MQPTEFEQAKNSDTLAGLDVLLEGSSRLRPWRVAYSQPHGQIWSPMWSMNVSNNGRKVHDSVPWVVHQNPVLTQMYRNLIPSTTHSDTMLVADWLNSLGVDINNAAELQENYIIQLVQLWDVFLRTIAAVKQEEKTNATK